MDLARFVAPFFDVVVQNSFFRCNVRIGGHVLQKISSTKQSSPYNQEHRQVPRSRPLSNSMDCVAEEVTKLQSCTQSIESYLGGGLDDLDRTEGLPHVPS
jgi:hypothetical protein